MLKNNLRRFFSATILFLMVGTGCKTAPPKGTPGYDYTVQQGDSLEVLAKAYRDQGVQVTADEIMAANPGIKVTTNLQAGVQCVAPEPGARHFIPDKHRAYLDDMKAKARHGDAEMQYALAVHYESGKDMPQDYVKAAKWYERAARQGQGKSEFWLARLYDNGLGVKKNPTQGIKWLTKSAKHGYAEAQYFLGKRYQDGDGVPQNFTNAAKWYRDSANQGVPWAQFHLSRLYYNGDGLAQDRSEAYFWCEKAAVKGLAEAQGLLGALYATGDGVEEDDAAAFQWFTRASLQGLPDSQSALGQMYLDGKGVDTNAVQAYKWKSLAAGNGEDSAKTILTNLEATMSSDELSEARRLAAEFKLIRTNSPNCSWSGQQIFSLKPESGTATGFFVTDDGYLVSNFHVVKDAGDIFLVTSTGTIPAEVVKVDQASDLALLKATDQFSALPVADSRQVKLGSPVMTVGFPDPPLMGFSAKFSRGDIAALAGVLDEPLRFQISVPIQPGNSGSALLDGCGNVVGVVSQSIDTMKALESNGSLPENVNYAIKSKYLLRLLDSVPELSSKLKPTGTEKINVEEIASRAEKASVVILIYGPNL